jgi:hypothetical protein
MAYRIKSCVFITASLASLAFLGCNGTSPVNITPTTVKAALSPLNCRLLRTSN